MDNKVEKEKVRGREIKGTGWKEVVKEVVGIDQRKIYTEKEKEREEGEEMDMREKIFKEREKEKEKERKDIKHLI